MKETEKEPVRPAGLSDEAWAFELEMKALVQSLPEEKRKPFARFIMGMLRLFTEMNENEIDNQEAE